MTKTKKELYTTIKKARNLFDEINITLDGSKYYSKSEIKNNKNLFISAILYKDYDYISRFEELLNDDYGIVLYNSTIQLMSYRYAPEIKHTTIILMDKCIKNC